MLHSLQRRPARIGMRQLHAVVAHQNDIGSGTQNKFRIQTGKRPHLGGHHVVYVHAREQLTNKRGRACRIWAAADFKVHTRALHRRRHRLRSGIHTGLQALPLALSALSGRQSQQHTDAVQHTVYIRLRAGLQGHRAQAQRLQPLNHPRRVGQQNHVGFERHNRFHVGV